MMPIFFNKYPRARSKVAIAQCALACLLLAGCSQGSQESDPNSDHSKTQSEEQGQDIGAISELAEALHEASPVVIPDPIASASGVNGTDKHARDITVDVYEVTVREHDTFVSWSLRSSEGKIDTIGPAHSMSSTAGGLGPGGFVVGDDQRQSASLVALEIPGTNGRTYWPLQRPIGDSGAEENRVGCLCSGVPYTIEEEPQLMNGFYPKLPDEVDTVSLKIREFPLVENIPVTRE